MLKLGQNLKKVRLFLGKSQAELAEDIEISQGTLSKIETGTERIEITILMRILEKLDINLNWLVCDIGNIFYKNNRTKELAINDITENRIPQKMKDIEAENSSLRKTLSMLEELRNYQKAHIEELKKIINDGVEKHFHNANERIKGKTKWN